MNTTPRRALAACLTSATLLAISGPALAQQYDLNAIQQEKAQIAQYFQNCQSGLGGGMNDNFENYLATGNYGATEAPQGCDYNTLTQLMGRSYELDLMLARANGQTGTACEIEWMPGCPEPGQ